ncbi:MAG: hypothetical protein LBB11_02880 [Puniceicoccales bacterium]|nr:hypothetical protein [Puniceicoccales bacterium]
MRLFGFDVAGINYEEDIEVL